MLLVSIVCATYQTYALLLCQVYGHSNQLTVIRGKLIGQSLMYSRIQDAAEEAARLDLEMLAFKVSNQERD